MQHDSSNLETVVYADGLPGVQDVAEQFHEGSKLSRATIGHDLSGATRLRQAVELQSMSLRSARSYPHRPAISLPEPVIPTASFHDVVTSRRSAPTFGPGPVPAQALSDVLHYSYRAAPAGSGPFRSRPTPSAGALYPLDVFVLTLDCDGLVLDDGGVPGAEACLYYDPFRHELAHLSDVDRAEVLAALGDAESLERAGVVVVVTAMFARSRFKYGTRGARFCYVEAGHLAQSLVLAAEATGLSARTYGGFFDDALTALVPGLDGVDSAPVHAVLLGTTA